MKAWLARSKCANQHWSPGFAQAIVEKAVSRHPSSRLSLRPTRWLVLALLPGCLGGQTGTEEWVDPGEANGAGDSPCEDKKEPVSPDDDALGFSANDAFEFVLGAHPTRLAWASPAANVSFGPESGVSALEIEVAFSGEVRRVLSVPRERSGGGEGPAIAVGCPGPRLEADVTVRLVSASGALDEQLPAVLEVGEPGFATLTTSAKLESLGGSFVVTAASGVELGALSVLAKFSKDGHAGVLRGETSTAGRDGSASHGMLEFGRWPAENACSSQGDPVIPVPVSLLAPPFQEALAQLSSAVAETFTWNSRETTTIAFEVTAGSSACVVPPNYGALTSLKLPVALQVHTADGRVDTTLLGELTAPGAGEQVELRAGRSCDGESPAAQASACGLSGLDLREHGSLSLSLSASISEASGANGELTVFGVPPTSCEPTPNSACGSPGSSAIEGGRF